MFSLPFVNDVNDVKEANEANEANERRMPRFRSGGDALLAHPGAGFRFRGETFQLRPGSEAEHLPPTRINGPMLKTAI